MSELAVVRKNLHETLQRMSTVQRVFFYEFVKNPHEPEKAARRVGHKTMLRENAMNYLEEPLVAHAVVLYNKEEELRFNVTLDDIHKKIYDLCDSADKDSVKLTALRVLEKRLASHDPRYSANGSSLNVQHKTKVMISDAVSKTIEMDADSDIEPATQARENNPFADIL